MCFEFGLKGMGEAQTATGFRLFAVASAVLYQC